MLGYILTFLLIIAILFGIFNGQTNEITKSVTDGAGDAIKLSIAMIGLMAFWSGIMEIAKRGGLVNKLSNIFRPIIKLLIPDAKKDIECELAISLNVTANILGLGNAATPMGIKAMKKLKEFSKGKKLSKSITYFLVINCASIQLIPSTVSAIRSAAGSAQPFKVMPAIWITSGLTLIVALLVAKLLYYFVGGKNGS